MGPMTEWNRNALISLTAQLKEKVIIRYGLNSKLRKAAGGFMSNLEAQKVEGMHDDADQMGELIRILLGKNNAAFGTFCQMLRDVDCGVWANQLEEKARQFKGESGTHVL